MRTAYHSTHSERAGSAADLVDHLPVALVMVDLDGVVRHANQRAAELIGAATPDRIVGQSVWRLIEAADVPIIAGAFAPQAEFATTVLGPVSIRLRTYRGTTAPTQCWARVMPAETGFAGFLVTLAPESTLDLIAAAMRGIAAGGDLERALAGLAQAAGAVPLNGVGSILSAIDGALVNAHGTWPFPEERVLSHPDTPWSAVALGTRDGGQWLVDTLPPAAARVARTHGYASVWVEPIDVDGVRHGAFVVWRESALPPFLSHLASLREAAAAAALAFAQHAHRHRLQQAALDDHLTGVGNRGRLEARLRHPVTQPSGVMFIDLDYFKEVNDRHGHLAGDRVLRIAAERLTRLARPQDAVYRVGGDEFVIICGPSTDHWAARQLVERMARYVVEAIRQPFDIDGTSVVIGASVGVAVADADVALDLALDLADDALLAAKRDGRGRWQTLI